MLSGRSAVGLQSSAFFAGFCGSTNAPFAEHRVRFPEAIQIRTEPDARIEFPQIRRNQGKEGHFVCLTLDLLGEIQGKPCSPLVERRLEPMLMRRA